MTQFTRRDFLRQTASVAAASWALSRFPIVLSSLQLDSVRLLHLPSECFVQYQLKAQQIDRSQFVATAAYGDGGPWYIPVEDEYPHGGYEVSVAFCDPQIDGLLTEGMRALLKPG